MLNLILKDKRVIKVYSTVDWIVSYVDFEMCVRFVSVVRSIQWMYVCDLIIFCTFFTGESELRPIHWHTWRQHRLDILFLVDDTYERDTILCRLHSVHICSAYAERTKNRNKTLIRKLTYKTHTRTNWNENKNKRSEK